MQAKHRVPVLPAVFTLHARLVDIRNNMVPYAHVLYVFADTANNACIFMPERHRGLLMRAKPQPLLIVSRTDIAHLIPDQDLIIVTLRNRVFAHFRFMVPNDYSKLHFQHSSQDI
jgi:hypothetical protein